MQVSSQFVLLKHCVLPCKRCKQQNLRCAGNSPSDTFHDSLNWLSTLRQQVTRVDSAWLNVRIVRFSRKCEMAYERDVPRPASHLPKILHSVKQAQGAKL